jgi:hypothetical protein
VSRPKKKGRFRGPRQIFSAHQVAALGVAKWCTDVIQRGNHAQILVAG